MLRVTPAINRYRSNEVYFARQNYTQVGGVTVHRGVRSYWDSL